MERVKRSWLTGLAAPIFILTMALVTAGSRSEASSAIPTVIALYRRFSDEHTGRRRAAGIESEASPLEAFVREMEA